MNEIASGITSERLYDDRVIVYTILSVNLTAINRWSSSAIQTLEDWPKNRPYLALHDISRPGIGLLYVTAVQNDIFNIGVVPEARKRIQEDLLKPNPDWKVALALVVSPSLSSRLAQLLFHDATDETPIHRKAYFDRSSALTWLAQMGGITPPHDLQGIG